MQAITGELSSTTLLTESIKTQTLNYSVKKQSYSLSLGKIRTKNLFFTRIRRNTLLLFLLKFTIILGEWKKIFKRWRHLNFRPLFRMFNALSYRSPLVRVSKRVLDFRNMDSGFLELYSGFQSPGFRMPQAKISRISLHVVILNLGSRAGRENEDFPSVTLRW